MKDLIMMEVPALGITMGLRNFEICKQGSDVYTNFVMETYDDFEAAHSDMEQKELESIVLAEILRIITKWVTVHEIENQPLLEEYCSFVDSC